MASQPGSSQITDKWPRDEAAQRAAYDAWAQANAHTLFNDLIATDQARILAVFASRENCAMTAQFQ